MHRSSTSCSLAYASGMDHGLGLDVLEHDHGLEGKQVNGIGELCGWARHRLLALGR